MKFPSLTLPCLCRYCMLFPVILLGCSFLGFIFSPVSTDQMSARQLKESPLQISGILFLCIYLSWRTLPCPSSLCLPGFSALCLQLRKFTGCYLGFLSLPHGLGALSRQTLGKSLTFHLVFITWVAHCLQSIISYILSAISVVLTGGWI